MKKNFLFIVSMMMLLDLTAQKIDIEHYSSYTPSVQQFGSSTLFNIQSSKNWSVEIRHNYDMDRSVSANAGKSFIIGNKCVASVRPMLGIVIGSSNGINFNLDQELEWERWYISSKNQYFLSFTGQDFLYTWLEAGFGISTQLYGGLTLQGNIAAHQSTQFNKGLVVGFSSGRWNFPIYLLDPLSCERNIIAGVFYSIRLQKRSQTQPDF